MARRRFTFAPLGKRGERYPDFVQATKGRSGVYLIRKADGGELLYVGESHAGKLYETLTRHFQEWARRKRFWSTAGFSRHDPGLTYKREAVDVAVVLLPASLAIDEQNRLIASLCPRDNLDGAESCAKAGDVDDGEELPDIAPF